MKFCAVIRNIEKTAFDVVIFSENDIINKYGL